jgi:hypothetical protein
MRVSPPERDGVHALLHSPRSRARDRARGVAVKGGDNGLLGDTGVSEPSRTSRRPVRPSPDWPGEVHRPGFLIALWPPAFGRSRRASSRCRPARRSLGLGGADSGASENMGSESEPRPAKPGDEGGKVARRRPPLRTTMTFRRRGGRVVGGRVTAHDATRAALSAARRPTTTIACARARQGARGILPEPRPGEHAQAAEGARGDQRRLLVGSLIAVAGNRASALWQRFGGSRAGVDPPIRRSSVRNRARPIEFVRSAHGRDRSRLRR